MSSFDPYSLGPDEFRSRLRHEFAVMSALPRKVRRRRADHHARMAESALKHARALGRPGYWEAPGFAADRGREVPYGPFSRAHWKYIRLAMRSAFLAGVHDAMGTTDEISVGGSRSLSLITGITP